MQTTLMKHDTLIQPGTTITGKWQGNAYTVKRKLGQGAIGTVYLCESKGRLVAMKMSDTASNMTIEVNVLRTLKDSSHLVSIPQFIETDDWYTVNGEQYSFYIMEFVEGIGMTHFLRRNGADWLGVFVVQMLDGLSELHKLGYAYGDLKLDNVLVEATRPKIRFVDAGGVTKIGRAIKEYTAFNDRAYWGLGTRRAEEKYDLFAVAMLIVHIFYPKQFKKKEAGFDTIRESILRVPSLKQYQRPLLKAIQGHYENAEQMKQDVIVTLRKLKRKTPRTKRATRKHQEKRRSLKLWLEGTGIAFVALLYYVSSLLLP